MMTIKTLNNQQIIFYFLQIIFLSISLFLREERVAHTQIREKEIFFWLNCWWSCGRRWWILCAKHGVELLHVFTFVKLVSYVLINSFTNHPISTLVRLSSNIIYSIWYFAIIFFLQNPPALLPLNDFSSELRVYRNRLSTPQK